MTVPDFLIWHCAGCGVAAEGKKKPCGCTTNVGTREGPNGKREQTWWEEVPTRMVSEVSAEWDRGYRAGRDNSQSAALSNAVDVQLKLQARLDDMTAERDRLKAALEFIAAQGDMTLLGPEWDTERHHELGANKAFNQMACAARDALSPATPTDNKES